MSTSLEAWSAYFTSKKLYHVAPSGAVYLSVVLQDSCYFVKVLELEALLGYASVAVNIS